MANGNSQFMDKLGQLGGYAGLISAVLGFGASVINYFGQKKTNQQLMNYNREEAEKQRSFVVQQTADANAWNERMWEKTNEYNTPENQVERLKDAGLNPLYYGLDGQGAGGISAVQPLSYERASLGSLVNPMSVGLNALLSMAQVGNIEAQTNKVKSETKAIDARLPFEVDNLKAQVRQSNLSSDAQEVINKYIDAQQQAELRVQDATVADIDAKVQKAFAEIDKMDIEKTTMMIGWLETQEKILTLQKNRELTDKQMEELSSLIAVNSATAKKIGLDVSNYEDIQVIGTASHNIHMGPFSVQEGQPITLGMLKAAREHVDELKDEKRKDKKGNNSYGLSTQDSPYTGPIYD